MLRRDFLIGCGCAMCAIGAARRDGLIEPHMHFVPAGGAPQVAMTLDACMGEIDMRILGPLIDNRIAVTIFATERWLDHNPATVGATAPASRSVRHRKPWRAAHPGVIGTEKVYGLAPAGTANGVFAEVSGGQQAVTVDVRPAPRYGSAMQPRSILDRRDRPDRRDGLKIARLLAQRRPRRERLGRRGAGAHRRRQSGDVIISHINQPRRPSGAGVIAGLLGLKAAGFSFIHLDDAPMIALA